MTERPLAGGSIPRIRAARSGAKSGRSKHALAEEGLHGPQSGLSSAQRERDRQRNWPPERGSTVASRAPRKSSDRFGAHHREGVAKKHLKSRELYTSAIKTWLASALAILLTFLNHRHKSGIVALQNAVLYDRDWEAGRASQRHPSVEIFAAPKPFIGQDAVHQTRAIESWIKLEPRPIVTLLGTGQGYAEAVNRFGLKWKPEIDSTFLGIPLFSAIVAAANASDADVAVIANADIMLFDDFHFTIRKVDRDIMFPWMIIGARWDIERVPASDETGPRSHMGLSDRDRLAIVQHARENGTLHTYGGIDVWAWNTKTGAGLYDGTMPHFVFGRGKYDNWFTHEVITAGHRHVIDASEACTFVHVVHDHHLVTDSVVGQAENSSATADDSQSHRAFWNEGSRSKFELYINTYLAAAHGSYMNQMGTVLHAPLKVQSCFEPEGLCAFRRRRPHSCRCEHSSFVPRAQSDPFALEDSRLIFCGLLSSDSKLEDSSDSGILSRFVVSGRQSAHEGIRTGVETSARAGASPAESSLHGALLEVVDTENQLASSRHNSGVFGLPLVLSKLLTVVEHRTNSTRVLVTLLNSHYKSLLPRFVCSARKAGVFDSLIIGALDDETYHFAVTRGLAVYLETSVYHDSREESVAIGARFDSPGYPVILALRARVTRKLTRLGREVFYADPDVLMQKNPFEAVAATESKIALLRGNELGATSKPSLSAAMLYAVPDPIADQVLAKLELPSFWGKTVDGSSLQGFTYTLLDATLFRNVGRTVPAEAERKDAVALHIGLPGEAYRKIALLEQAPDLDRYDDLAEVCRVS